MQFLDVTYQAPLDSIQEHEAANGSTIYSCPFFFIVPLGTEYPNHDKPLLCRVLPPSFEISDPHSESLSVTYELHTVVHYHEAHAIDGGTPGKTEMTRVIKFLPFSEVGPPTHIASFPGEFNIEVTSSIRKHTLASHLGTFTLRTSEPLPLAYSQYEKRASTECALSIIAHASHELPRLRAISLEVKPAIKVKTFYSAEPITCLPKRTFLAENALIRLREDVIKLGRETYTQLEWGKVSGPVNDKPPAYEEATGYNAQNRSTTESNLARDRKNILRTSIQVPVRPPVTLPPTFCGSLITRSYSLLLRMRVFGVHAQRISLEVPLQVVYLRATPSRVEVVHDPESMSCIGASAILAQDDVGYLRPL